MRKRGFAVVAIVAALALVTVGCSKKNGSSSDWATATSASAGGGMDALVSAAKAEGALNVIALPHDWANYGKIIETFKQKYPGITVNEANPAGSSQDEVDAVAQQKGTAAAPDVLDVGMAVAYANTSDFAPYQVATWGDIPASQKESTGLWYQDYGGYMAVGYDSAKFGTITSLSQLTDPKFKNAVALNGNPTEANAALNGVMLASLNNGGSADDISKGVDWFSQLNAAGNFNKVQATAATVKAGTTPVVFDWDYLSVTDGAGVPTWKILVPSQTVGGYYAQAVNKDAPHPAAARLWEEFLFSQDADGGQNLWLQGGAHPVELVAMTSNGSADSAAAAKLPKVNGTPVFLTQQQATDAATYVGANWTKAIS